MLAGVPNLAEDRDLVAGVLDGNTQAITQFCTRYIHVVHGVLRRYGGLSPAEIDDLVQAVFERVIRDDYRTLRQWRRESPLAAYMKTIARNLANDYVTTGRRVIPLEDGEGLGLPEPEVGDPGPEELALLDEIRAMMNQALGRLGHEQQEILRLSEYEELTYSEIAQKLGCTTNVVGVRLNRAKSRLKRIVEQEFLALREYLRW